MPKSQPRSPQKRLCSLAGLGTDAEPFKGWKRLEVPETPSKLQVLQPFAVAGSGDGKMIRSNTDQTIYVGMTDLTNRLVLKEKKRKKKKGVGEKDQEESGIKKTNRDQPLLR